jgi:hypothetical protein
MKRSPLPVLVALLATALAPPAAGAVAHHHHKPPSSFFGVVTQAAFDSTEAAVMRKGGIGRIGVSVDWSLIEPSPGRYEWYSLDNAVSAASQGNIRILPHLEGTPSYLASTRTELPIGSEAARAAWVSFLRAAVARYGPGGSFWAKHGPESAEPLPTMPIREWQIWNEPNFFYFTTPASPRQYAKLLKISAPAIKSVDPRAKVILGGLFGVPKGRPPRAMAATAFLRKLYRMPGVRRDFDGVALHPYAAGIRRLAKVTSALRKVMSQNHDRRTGLYITEMGWGSQNDPRRVAFEVGWRDQARMLERAYRYLILNRHKLNLKAVYWYSWKDASKIEAGLCNFCDSTGLFRYGDAFRPKPAWLAFQRFSHGREP